MFANLSTAILYFWALNNNIDLPIIIPILLLLRSLAYVLPKNNLISKFINLQQSSIRKIEYIFAVLINLLLVFYLLFSILQNYKISLEYFLIGVIILYVILLIINLFYIKFK